MRVNVLGTIKHMIITKTYTGFIRKFYDIEPNTLIYALKEFVSTILQNYTHYRYNFYNIYIFSIIKFQGLVARQPHLCTNIFSVLLRYIWLLGTFVNSSCDIKLNIKVVKIAV